MFRNHQQTERTLQVELTPDELLEKGRELSTAIIERLRIKNKAKYIAEGFTAEIKLFEQQIETLGMLVSEGKEFQKVKCVETVTASGIEVETTRLDTGEFVSIRPMTAEERQENLFDNTPEILLDTEDSHEKTSESLRNAAAFLGVPAKDFRTEETESLIEEATAQGTPMRTVLTQGEMDRLARYFNFNQVREYLPLTIQYIDGAPLIPITGETSPAGNWANIVAWHVLPAKIAGAGIAYADDGEYLNVRVNAGTKSSPKHWVMVGPEIRFTVATDTNSNLFGELPGKSKSKRSKRITPEDAIGE